MLRMGSYHQVALAFLGVMTLALAQFNPRILFIGMERFRPGSQYEATVTSLSVSQLSVTVSIVNNDTKQIVASASNIIPSDTQAFFTLPIAIDQDPNAKYVVRVEEGASYFNETEVQFERKSRSIFITTDKSIYKPGATVKFRAFGVDASLRPKTDPMTVEIYDPKFNKIKQWIDQTSLSGVVSGELDLSSQTPLGKWKIKVTSMSEEETLEFEVDEYVLPKFEVTVSLTPTFLLSTKAAQTITAAVKAQYNTGKPVDGQLLLTAEKATWHDVDKISRSQQISGIANVPITFPANAFKLCRVCGMVVEANVTDSLTGETRSARVKFQVWERAELITFLPGQKYIKPGLMSKFEIQLTQVDGKPLPNIGEQVTATVSEYVRGTNRPTEKTYSFPLPDSGILSVNHMTAVNATRLDITAEYNGASAYSSMSSEFKTLSGNSLEVEEVRSGNQLPSAGDQVQFRVRATEPIQRAYYQIISKGTVTLSGNKVNSQPSTEFFIPISATESMSPKSTMLVYYLNVENEIIAAVQTFRVKFGFQNNVTISWDAREKKVNENAVLTVQAAPNSYVSVGAVDQSVLLLGESNDITMDRVVSELEEYDRTGGPSYPGDIVPFRRVRRSIIWFPYFSASDTDKLLSSIGLVYMTDAFVFNAPPVNEYPIMFDDRMMIMEAAGGPNIVRKTDTGGGTNDQVVEVFVRKFFPESWTWESATAGPDGRASFSLTVPDTITKWVATAFALHPTTGLGIPPDRANLTAFQPFFMSVDKPYSVVRGEQITIQVLVFNYLGVNTEATVELIQSPEFNVKENPNDVVSVSKTISRTVPIEDQKGSTVKFTIIPQQLGYVSLRLRARAAGGVAADAIDETLLVKPEGREIESNMPLFIQMDSSSPSFSARKSVLFPEVNVVAGSRSITINVIGDVLGTTLTGVSRLIRMPTGCGEQNMVTFVPVIAVRGYLESTGEISDTQLADTTRYMEDGYQRELTYQRKDHSFSAFGDRDEMGSTWLTAFVVQSFKQAERYIYIDDSVLTKSISWLIQSTYDRNTASFREVGRVLHEGMQGGSKDTMTAYVLIALEMCRELNQTVPDYLDTMNAVRQKLENAVEGTSDPYLLAIMGYALQLSGSASVPRILSKLDATATVDSGMRYWKLAEKQNCRGCHRKGNEVELAAFVLLTSVARGDLGTALDIGRFLMSAKNPRGGFYSTQDTAWGLHALTEFGKATKSSGQQFTVQVSVGPNFKREFSVTSTNSQVLQTAELADVDIEGNPVDVVVEASGTGSGLVEISSQYYTTRPEDNNSLKLRMETKERNSLVREITSCVKLENPAIQDMIVVQIGEPTGMAIDQSSINMGDKIRRVERDQSQTSVSIYYDELTVGQEECTRMLAYKQYDVENVQAPVAKAFGYYTGVETTAVVPTKPTGGAGPLSGSALLSVFLTLSVSLLCYLP